MMLGGLPGMISVADQAEGRKGPIFASRLTPRFSKIRIAAMVVTILLTLATVILVCGVKST